MSAASDFDRPTRAAWIAVAVLWGVALLNYLDRLMIVTMHGSVVADIPMTEAQFGLLTSVFLWIYALASPLGGFLADKLGKKRMIVGSLIIWSAVTWLTGHARSFHELLVVRAIMGISEACYIPAAVALISDHHRGRTRSLATGIHGSGIYTGAALGGIGGIIAEHFGWRIGFTMFGLLGVLYGIAVCFLLCEAPPLRSEATASEPLHLAGAGRALFWQRYFWIILLVNLFVGVSNWLVYGWLPTFLREQFHLGEGAAGLSATAYLQVASFLAILGGGIWADRWCATNPRARVLVTLTGFCAAAPALFLTGSANVLTISILGLIFYGVGRGFYDANLMPIMRQVIDERYSATGYGILNFTGNLMGGLMTYLGGVARDAQVPLGVIFQSAAAGLFATCLLLLFIRPRAAQPTAAVPVRTS